LRSNFPPGDVKRYTSDRKGEKSPYFFLDNFKFYKINRENMQTYIYIYIYIKAFGKIKKIKE